MSNKLKIFILSILVSGFLFSDAPDWQINPPSYEFSGSVSSAVYINDELVGNDNDMLAGFVDGEIRGVV